MVLLDPTETRKAWRLGRRSRKVVLLVHIASAGAWLGIDIVLGVMVGTALLTDDEQTAEVALASLGLFAVWPLVSVGLVCLGTGLLLGLGSRYGLVRFWWVAAKLAINVLLVVLVVLALRPGVEDVSAAAGRALTDGSATPLVGTMVFPPVVSTALLLVAMALAVGKPWGRIRSRR